MSSRSWTAAIAGVYARTVMAGALFAGSSLLAQGPPQGAPPPPPGAPPAQAAPAASPPSPAAVERANTILAAARAAMGGAALDGVKTLTAAGRTKRVRGNNLVPIEFELGIEFPDKYFRKDEFPAEETDPTSVGFNGWALVQNPAPAAPMARAGGPPPHARHRDQTGLRAIRARDVPAVLRRLSSDVRVRGAGRSPAGQSRRARRHRGGRVQAALPHRRHDATADHGELAAPADERHRHGSRATAAGHHRARRRRHQRARPAAGHRDRRGEGRVCEVRPGAPGQGTGDAGRTSPVLRRLPGCRRRREVPVPPAPGDWR